MPNLRNFVTSVFDKKYADRILEVAKERGMSASILATEGQRYTAHSGFTYVLPEGKAYVKIDYVGDLRDFWKAVNEKPVESS